jgi:hypothetical protein
MSNPLTQSDIDQLEVFADKLFAKVGIDVEFTRHFLDRVNDQRNKKQITMGELTRLFKQEYRKWGKPIAKLGPDAEAVMKDLQTDINLPFALRWDAKNNELDLIAKTVMRKKDFKTSNQEFAVEDRKIKNPMEKQVEVRGLGVYSVGGLQKNIASKLRELADKAERGDPSSFRQINYLMNNGVMDAMLEGLINAYDDLARQTIYRREFGEGIDKENAPYSDRDVKHMYEKWSEKYKKSIDCNNPKGFSQKAHCAGRKKR